MNRDPSARRKIHILGARHTSSRGSGRETVYTGRKRKKSKKEKKGSGDGRKVGALSSKLSAHHEVSPAEEEGGDGESRVPMHMVIVCRNVKAPCIAYTRARASFPCTHATPRSTRRRFKLRVFSRIRQSNQDLSLTPSPPPCYLFIFFFFRRRLLRSPLR